MALVVLPFDSAELTVPDPYNQCYTNAVWRFLLCHRREARTVCWHIGAVDIAPQWSATRLQTGQLERRMRYLFD
jgi:hypothetical protein